MQKLKLFLVSGLVLMLVLTFGIATGCASSATTTTAAATETTAATTTTTAPTEVKVIRFVTPETDPATAQLFSKQIAEFEALNPGVKVQIELVPLANLNTYYATNSAAGIPPECGGCPPGIFAQYVEQGSLAPLDDVIANLGGEEEFFTGALLKGTDGKVYNLPYCGGGPVIYIRTDLYEKYNVKPPETWDEWLEAAKALTIDENNDGTIDIYGQAIPAGKNDYTEILVSILTWQQGKTMWDADMMPTFNTSEAANSLKFLKELAQYCPPGIVDYSYYEVMDAYSSGRVAMTIYYGRLLQHLRTNAPDLLPVTKCIPMPYNSEYNIKETYADYDQYVVFKDSKYPEEGKKFIEFITSGDRIADFMLTVPGHILPATKTNAQLEKFWNDEFVKSQEENIKVLFDVPSYGMCVFANEAGAQLIDNKWVPLPDMVNTNIAKTWPEGIVGQALQKVLLGQSSAEEAVEWGQQEQLRILSESQ